MLLFDLTGLTFNDAVIDDADVQLLAYTHETGEMVLTATLEAPRGTVFFESNENCLRLFKAGKIKLQELFKRTAAGIVTVLDGAQYKLYMRSDVDVLLAAGEKMYSDFKKQMQ